MGDSAEASSPPAKSPPPAAFSSPPKSPASPVAVPRPIPVAEPLAVDEHPEEDTYDLGIDMGAESDTDSLRSSILKYRQENGRTYHAYKDGSYLAPNDETEVERLDLQHTIFLLTFDAKLQVAPLKSSPHRVLDVGCGTGIWSIEFADEHPESQVTGVDLSPIQPAFVPPNCQFFVDDVEDDWNFSTPFDLVFARFMTGSIQNWPGFFKQAYENLNPGGTIELQDHIFPVLSDDGTLSEDSALGRFCTLFNEGFRGVGRPMDSGLHFERQLQEAGFVDIGVVQEKWPLNQWPRDRKHKQIGIWNLENLINALPAFSFAVFTRPTAEGGLGWSREETEVLLAGVRQDMRNTDIHSYIRVNAYYARKP